MRITEGVMSQNFLNDFDKIQNTLAKDQTQVATNTRIQTLSDDVNGTLKVVDLKSQISKLKTYLKNADNISSYMTSTQNSLDNIITELQNIKTTASSAENVINSENYTSIAQTIKDNLSSIVQSMNAKQNGMYLFGGTNNKGDVVTLVNNLAVPTAEDVSGEMKAQVSQNVNITMNIPGSKIINTGVLTSINNLITTLEAGNPPTDAELTALDKAYSSVVDIQSLQGTTQNRVEDITNILNNQSTNYDTLLTNIQSVDTAKLATDITSQQYLLQIVEKLIANTSSKSIFDYLT